MAEEIDFEDGRISNFQCHVTLTLTLDWAIWHIIVHHSSTSIYTTNFNEIAETFCGRTDVRTHKNTARKMQWRCYDNVTVHTKITEIKSRLHTVRKKTRQACHFLGQTTVNSQQQWQSYTHHSWLRQKSERLLETAPALYSNTRQPVAH